MFQIPRLYREYTLRLVIIALVLILFVPLNASAAPSATMSLSPALATLNHGDSVILTISVNASTNQITGAQACVTYDASKLSAATPNISGSALGYTTPSSSSDCTAGEIQVSRFDVTPASGTFTLATITFSATSSATTTPIGFDNATSYIKDSVTTDGSGNPANIMAGSTGSTLTLNAVAVPVSPAPSPSSSGSNQAPATTLKPTTQSAPTAKPAEPIAMVPTVTTPTTSSVLVSTIGNQLTSVDKTAKRSGTHLHIYIGLILTLFIALIIVFWKLLPIVKKSKTNASIVIGIPTPSQPIAVMPTSSLQEPGKFNATELPMQKPRNV